jgi:hypothetical protein
MEDVIARLRASKEEATKKREAEGFKHGQDWAKITAEFEQLEALSKIKDVDGLDDLIGAFADAWDTENEAVDDFCEELEEIARIMERSEAYTRGFIKGAQSVFGQVKDKL